MQKRIKELNGELHIPSTLRGEGHGGGEQRSFSDNDELIILKQYLTLSDQETTANKKIKEAQSALEKKVLEKYKALTEAECHRTQSGKLHKVMKAIMKNAVFIGFTGTPLLKQDKRTSLEVFGKYIHTYKFNKAVEDEVVRDLIYEARDIDQNITSQQRIDEWFDAKTNSYMNLLT